jgi:hypothetical protein
LHDAVEQAARCFSVNASQMQYYGSSADICPKCLLWNEHTDIQRIEPVCGNQVAGSVSVQLSAILADFSVPLSATACFPLNN